jgi:hypothetical protein
MGKPFVGPLPTLSQVSASGVWQMDEVFEYRAKNSWPDSSYFSVEYLVIAGGGGAGGTSSTNRAGGGAGGYRCSVVGESSGGGSPAEPVATMQIGETYAVTVGAGGATRTNGSSSYFGSIFSIGGGSATVDNLGVSGGSGSGVNNYGYTSGVTVGGISTPSQGYAGGSVTNVGGSGCKNYVGSGGGGAGGVGGNALDDLCNSTCFGGDGGIGLTSSITGSPVGRGGGGGGGNENVNRPDGNASDGGGAAARPGLSGTANTGGGGGGMSGYSTVGGSGGSGVVIIKYPATRTATFSAGVAQTTTTSGGYKVSVVTAAGVSDTVTFA